MARTALVTGATGLLGRQVVEAFRRQQWNVVGTGYTRAKPPILRLNLQSNAEIEKALEEHKPHVVVHCAANKYPDQCDKDPEAARTVNVTASATLARLCAASSILLIYISTDYVFSGIKGEAPYQVDSPPAPPNTYGRTKWEGEKAVLAEFEKAQQGFGVALRVPVLYGQAETSAESSINSLMDTVWKAQETGAQIKVDHYALRYPTNTEDVGRVCQDIATKYIDTENRVSLPKVLQFTSEDRFTKYEICQIFAEIMGLSKDGLIANTEADPPDAKIKRPYDAHLSTQALQDWGIDTTTMDFKGWWGREARAYRK